MPASSKHIHLVDISRVLKSELQAAYELLSKPEYGHLWDQFCTAELTDAIHRVSAGESQNDVNRIRREFMASLPVESQHKVTSGLAWVIIVEAALLNESLTHDMRRVGQQKGCMECVPIEGINFCLPTPAPEAIEAFKSYVNCRWPIHVFALDPVNQEQNISDSFSRRRELQLAVAVAVATGEMNVNAAGNYMRRLETDIDTIALNRTHFAFAHDHDTFGWRFQPRFQSPDTAGQLRAFGETLFGTRRNADIRDQKIEPGMRECVAVVIMPSFVPYVTLSSRANWYDLVNPRRKEWTMKETMKLSRNYQAVQSRVHAVCAGNCYRSEDVLGLSDSLSQLEKRFPIQQRLVQIPYENTSGGFEIFSEGVTDLGPELLGWYGAPGIRVGEATEPSTSLFLVGDGFSVHETRFIVGGHAIAKENVRLLSRQIAEVIIPPTVNIVDYEAGNPVKKYVDAHVATPYGATNHLLIPVYVPPKKAEAKKIAEEIAALKKTTDVMQSISIKPADGTKYAFDTVCPQEQGGPLRFDLRDASKVRVLNFESNSPIADPSELVFEIALFDNGFVTPMLALKNAEIALDANDSAKGKITLKQGALENVVARLPGLATLAKLKEAEDHKKTYKVVFFMRTVKRKVADVNQLPNDVNVPRPIRVGGDLPIEVKLTCDCCKGGSCATHTASRQSKSQRGVRVR